MDQKAEVKEFLATRRARITPDQAGLQLYGGKRRVPGLRREEVAMLAGVSVDYYTKLEKGNLAGVSDSVIDAIAKALQLDDAEREHLFNLAKLASSPAPNTLRRRAQQVRRSLQLVLNSMALTPAFISNGRIDILAANTLGKALYAPAFEENRNPPNLARFCFFDSRALDFYPNWDMTANMTVAILRTAAGRDPYDKALSDLIGELATRSEEFRTRWAAHNVRRHRTGTKTINHPEVGPLDLMYDVLAIPMEDGLTMTTYSAEPGSSTEDKLKLLASWNATQAPAL